MKTKQDFIAIIDQTADKYDQVAALRRAGDPRYFQHQEAMATMFAMLSQQIEIGMMEPFDKVRDATVLADAALKGVVPKATSARVRLMVKNTNKSADFKLDHGRRLIDSNGLLYLVDRPVVIAAASSDSEPGTGYVEAVQKSTRVVTHQVTESRGFYSIEIPLPTDGQMLSSIELLNQSGELFKYSHGFTNISPDEKVYHVETDEYQRIFVKFGLAGIVGYQPQKDEIFTLKLSDCNGNVVPEGESPFNLEYAYTPADGQVTLSFYSLITAGSNPISMAELRELCRYPSTYDESAVYRGEFDFLVRRNLPGLQFLSIWNEQIEERVRGASVDNINKLFVSCVPASGANVTETFDQVKRLIIAADDSYKVAFVNPIELPIVIHVSVQIARVHDAMAVKNQITQAVLSEYGKESIMARRGMVVVQFKRIYEFLRSKIGPLQDAGSDFSVSIGNQNVEVFPENWRFVTTESLTVEVSAVDYSIESWGV